jgi:glycosyltransferase involved in cell wall biosynthesis
VDIKYSFVIPTIGNRENIFKIIDGICKPVMNSYEILVVLQITGNTNKTIAERLKNIKSISLFTDTEHASAAMARNIGARMSKGKILCFIDDDVIFAANFLECLNSFENLTRRILFPEIRNENYVPFPLGDHVGGRTFVSTCFLIDRQVYLMLGGMNENLLQYRDDSEFFIRAVKKGISLEFAQGFYIWHPIRNTNSKTIRQMFKKQQLEPFFHKLVSGSYAGILQSEPYNFTANRYGFSVASYFLLASSFFIAVSALSDPLVLLITLILYFACALVPSVIYFRKPRKFLKRSWSSILARISIYLILFPVFILARIIGSIRYRHFTL